jgi:hypothetical protein
MWIGLTLACLTLAAGFASNPAAARGTQGPQYGNQYGNQNRPQNDRPQQDQGQRRMRRGHRNYRSVTVPQGTIVAVTINDNISTERSTMGDTWQGVMQQAVVVNGRVVIPAGTYVSGTVNEVLPPQRGQDATLCLQLDTVDRFGRSYSLPGSMEPIVAGSTRARDIGIVAGGAVTGAVIGHAIGHSTKGTIIGGLLGGLAGGAFNHAKGGYNIELKPPFTVEFTVDQPVAFNN